MDTGTYFYAGYAVILILIPGYASFLYLRWREINKKIVDFKKK